MLTYVCRKCGCVYSEEEYRKSHFCRACGTQLRPKSTQRMLPSTDLIKKRVFPRKQLFNKNQPLLNKDILCEALDILLQEKLSKLPFLKKGYVLVERIREERIEGGKSLLFTIRVVVLDQAIQDLELSPWDGVVLTKKRNSTEVYGWGIFLGALSDKDCYIAIETEDLRLSEGDHYFLAKENTIPLIMNQLRILEWLTVSSWVGQILIADKRPKRPVTSLVRLLPKVELNQSQMQAYTSVISLPEEDFFLVHGPPGTGKTRLISSLLFDAIINNRNVLICSHTNVAVDNALEKLLDLCSPAEKRNISRIGSLLKTSRRVYEVLPQMRFGRVPTISEIYGEISRRRVIGMTLSKLGIVRRFGLEKMHFDYVIIDEASMASIPLSLVGITEITKRFVLVGDHKQLAPIVAADDEHVAEQLGISLFEMMISKYPEKSILLDTQYRCSKNIMDYCSETFYNNQVKTDASVAERRPLRFSAEGVKLTWLKAALENESGLIWIDTTDLPDSNSSWMKYGYSWSAYNKMEAAVVLELWRQLLNRGLHYDQLSVMSPFRLQTDLLRDVSRNILKDRGPRKDSNTFFSLDKKDTRFTTIDANQGREFDVVIFNVTKSYVGRDSDRRQRLLGDWRRLNVALTRAKKKVYIVGNRGVAEPKLFNYFRLYSKARQHKSLIKTNRRELPSRKLVGGIERKIDSLKKKPAKKRKAVVGLSPEEKHLLDNIKRYRHRRHKKARARQ